MKIFACLFFENSQDDPIKLVIDQAVNGNYSYFINQFHIDRSSLPFLSLLFSCGDELGEVSFIRSKDHRTRIFWILSQFSVCILKPMFIIHMIWLYKHPGFLSRSSLKSTCPAYPFILLFTITHTNSTFLVRSIIRNAFYRITIKSNTF